MAVSIEYRLPGVYSSENTSQLLGMTAGGNATVALVGPALGYLSAAQRIILEGTDPVALNGSGIIIGSIDITERANGTEYVQGVDYEATQTASGNVEVKRHITALNTTDTAVSGLEFDFSTAQPTFSIRPDAVVAAGGYIIKGTVTVSGSTTSSPVEGEDYEIDYYNGLFIAKSDGALVNGEKLTIGYSWTIAEPIELVGEVSAELMHKFISKEGLVVDDTPITAVLVSCTYSYTDDNGTAADDSDDVTESYTYGDKPGITEGNYEEGVDYVVDYATGRIARTEGSRIPSYSAEKGNLMYIAFGYSGIKSGSNLIASYNYTDPTYYEPKYFASYNDLAAYYGNGWDSDTGDIVSPLTVAAYLATKNGMAGCYSVAVQGQTAQGGALTYTQEAWASAFDALTVVDNIDIVVPLSGADDVWALAQNHIDVMKQNEDERVAIIGADGSSSIIQPDEMITLAQGLNDDDMWLVSPSTFRMRNVVTGIVEVIPGYYAAAGVAGLNSSMSQYTPLTRKRLSGLYSANEYNAKTIKKNECANGLMYIDEVNGAMVILHGRTTSTASILQQESNIVLTKYYIIKTMRNAFDNGYIGSIITPDTLLSIKAAANTVLTELRDSDYMVSFSGLSARQNALNPTEVDISFSYRPTYSMNYIDITFSIDAGVE